MKQSMRRGVAVGFSVSLCVLACLTTSPSVTLLRAQEKKPDQQADAAPVETEALERDVEEEPKNPLERIFRGIFKKPEQPILPRGNADRPADPNAEKPAEGEAEQSAYERDFIDRCAPHNAALEKQYDKAHRYAQTGNHKIAIELLQQVLDQPGNDLIGLGPGRSELVRDVVARLLRTFPEEAQESYRLQYGTLAAQHWEQARATGDPVVIADVATRYLLTPAGAEAAEYLAALHVERGEWASARVWFARLREFYPNTNRTPAWYLKSALAYHRSGSPEEAARIIEVDLKGLETVRVGGESISPTQFVATFVPARTETTPELRDWAMPHGNPRRSAAMIGETPVLVPRWDIAATQSRNVVVQMEELLRDLREVGRATLSLPQPLVLDDKAIFRTLQGVAVVDLHTGERLWQTRPFHSPERILTGTQLNSQNYNEGVIFFNGNIVVGQYQGNGADQHPLAGLLFRDAVFGQLSANSRHLFAIENHVWMSQFMPGSYYGNGAEANDQLRRSWTTNQLTAYDLESGRIAWEIGGEKFNEPFDLPLAGNYFLGVPLVAGERLYVVGEMENEVRLHCLDAQTGHPTWSQLIGYSLHGMDRDFGRRFWSSQPALADGVIVCPNANGWLVAVDATSHSILWEVRFQTAPGGNRRAQRIRGNDREGMVEFKPLNGEWASSIPHVVDGKVFYAPREHDELHCLDLTTGKTIWKHPRQNSLAFAGAYGDRLLLLETDGITALSLDKTLLWKTKLDDEAGKPSGFPIITRDEIFLPTDSGNLWRLSLADGKVLGKQTVGAEHRPLGNLAFHDGRLISLDPLGARAFDVESRYRDELAARRAVDPNDGWCLLQEAQRLQLEAQREEALRLLRQIDPLKLGDADRERFEGVMYRTLADIVGREPTQHEDLFESLGEYVNSETRRMEYWQLRIDRLVAQRKYREAFDEFLRLSETEDPDRLVSQGTRHDIRIRLNRWLAGRLSDLLREIPADIRAELDAEIARRAETLDAQDDAKPAERFLELFEGHPATERVRERLALRLLERNQFVEAEHHLDRLTYSADREVAARATLRLWEEYRVRNRSVALWESLARAERDLGDVVLDGQSVSARAAEVRQSANLNSPPQRQRANWGEFDLESETGAVNYQLMQQYQTKLRNQLGPSVSDFRFDYNRNNQRLLVTNRNDDKMLWSVPLPGGGYHYNREAGRIYSSGHLVTILQSNSIVALSPHEKRVVWSRTIETNAGNNTYYYRSYANNSSQPSMVASSALTQSFGLMKEQREQRTPVVNARYICVQGNRTLHVFDTATGALQWTLDRLPTGATVFGSESELFVITPRKEDSLRIRVGDARPTPLGDATDLINRGLALDGADVILVDSQRRQSLLLRSKTVTAVRRVDLDTGEDRWRVELDGDLLLQMTETSLYALNRTDGAVSRVNLRSGNLETLFVDEVLKNDKSHETYLVETSDRIYMIQNNRPNAGMRVYRNYALEGIFANGVVLAFDRQTGKRLWSQELDSQFLMTEALEDSPVLLFVARSQEQRNNVWRNEQHTEILDANDGRRLFKNTAAYSSDMQALHIDHEQKRIVILSYNQRHTFRAVDRKPTDADAGSEAKASTDAPDVNPGDAAAPAAPAPAPAPVP